MKSYDDFLKEKLAFNQPSGFEVDPKKLNKNLFDWQKVCVKWALSKGKAGLFEDTGLGKTLQELAWAQAIHEHTKQPIIGYAPLAVSHQTIREGEKFGIKVYRVDSQKDIKNGINITNYERIDKFNHNVFGGAFLDECFAPDTKIEVLTLDNSLSNDYIKNIKIGDKIINVIGEDYVKKIKKRKIIRAVRLRICGKEIICSENHPWFTMYGWRSAQDLHPGNYIMATSTAMRLVRKNIFPEICSDEISKILQSILLSEMEDEHTGTQGKSLYERKKQETFSTHETMVQKWRNRSRKKIERIRKTFCKRQDGGIIRKNEKHINKNETQTFSAWGKWKRDDIASAINEGCIVRKLDTGIFYITGKANSQFSNSLQSRLRESRFKISNRIRRSFSQIEKRTRSKKRQKTGFFRVDSIEILELGHSDLDKYRDEKGDVYFYDIEATQHPSFSVNGCLVHNSGRIKAFTAKFTNAVIEAHIKIPYRLCASATPSPNDYTELGNTAEYLGIMTRPEMLSMFFINDSGNTTAPWRLKGHVTNNRFWEWLASWCIMIRKPSDIGYSDEKYILPKLNYFEHIIPYEGKKKGFFIDEASGLLETRNSMRETLKERCELSAKIINEEKDKTKVWVAWCNLNPEGDLLEKKINGAVQVAGATKDELKVKYFLDFADNKIKCLVTKPKIAMFGMNWQNCHNIVVTGLSHSFEQFYQLVRRFWRFGQKNEVNVHIVIGEREGSILKIIKRKEKQMIDMYESMTRHMRELMKIELQKTERKETEYNPKIEMKLPEWIK